MPEVALYDMSGEKVGQADLTDELFAATVNQDLLHQAVVTVEQGMRHDPAHTKSRSEVRLTKGKWYRQKGTGRARHGARSAPIFAGGGVAHGPRGKRRKLRLNRQMRRKALAAALSAKLHEGGVIVVDEMSAEEFSTRRRWVNSTARGPWCCWAPMKPVMRCCIGAAGTCRRSSCASRRISTLAMSSGRRPLS